MSFGFNSTSGFGSSNPSFGFGGASPGFGGLFGSSQPSTFGAASSGTSIFGGGSGFGGGGGVFGSGSSSPFGNTTNSTSMFGGASSGGSVFGSSSPFGGTSTFGNPSPFGGPTLGGGFGGAQSTTGTTHHPFSAPQDTESGAQGRSSVVSYQNIATMKQYENWSQEELRQQDYQAGNKGGTTSGGGGGFGSTIGGGSSVFGKSSFGANSQPFGGTSGGFGQSSTPQTSLFGGGGGFGSGPAPFGQSNPQSTFGGTTPAFGSSTGGSLFGGGTTGGFGASSGFGGFGTASTGPAGGGIFGNTSSGAFGAASSSPSLFGNMGNQTSNVFGGGTSFGVQSSGGAFGTSTFSAFGAQSSGGAFGAQSSGTSLFGASSGGLFGSTTGAFGASSGSNLFGGGAGTSLFGGASSSPSFFGASSSAPSSFLGASSGFGQTGLFGSTSQPSQGFGITTNIQAAGQGQQSWGVQNQVASGMPQNPQNFSDLYGRIAPDLPQSGPRQNIPQAGLRGVITQKRRLHRKVMVTSWSRDWQAERRKQAWKPMPSQDPINWWNRVGESSSVDIFGARRSGGDDGQEQENGADILSVSKIKETNVVPDSVRQLLAEEDEKDKEEEEIEARAARPQGERLLTEKEIKERLPIITEEDYFIKPNINGLTNMLRGDPNALKEVHCLVVGRKDYGQVRYEVPINLEGVNICQCICIRRGGVTLCGKNNPLDGKAEVTLEGVYTQDKEKKPKKDDKSIEKLVIHLKRYCKSEGVQFVSYEHGVWRFRTDSLG